MQVFEDAIVDAESGMTGWLKTINSYRIVRLMTYPARLPINMAKVCCMVHASRLLLIDMLSIAELDIPSDRTPPQHSTGQRHEEGCGGIDRATV